MVFMLPHGDHVQDMGDHRGHKIKLLGPVSNASEDRFWHVVAQTSQTGMEMGFLLSKKKHRRVKSDLCWETQITRRLRTKTKGSEASTTVDGRNPAPRWMVEIL